MFDVNVFGNYDFRDLATTPVSAVTQEDLYSQMQEFVGAQQAFLTELAGLLVDTESDNTTESFGTVQGGQMQDLTDLGNTEARRIGAKWSLAFPIFAKGDRFTYSQSFLDEAKLADLNQHVLSVTLADTNTNIFAINQAILNNANYSFDDDKFPGRKSGAALAVKRLANADGGAGSVYSGEREILLSTLNHYLVSGSGTFTEAMFTVARAALRNVGHDSQIVYLCSKADADLAEALPNFVKRNDATIVDPTKKYALVTSPRARGRIAGGEVWEWPGWPSGYVFAFDRSKAPPLRKRVHHLPKYRGLQMVTPEGMAGDIQGKPLLNKMWRNIYGYAVRNRVNGVVVHQHATTFAVPAGY